MFFICHYSTKINGHSSQFHSNIGGRRISVYSPEFLKIFTSYFIKNIVILETVFSLKDISDIVPLPNNIIKRHPFRIQDSFHLRSEEHTSELQSRQYLVC